MIVGVTGWRRHTDVAFIYAAMDRYVGVYKDFFVSKSVVRMGDADGADEIVRQWCRHHCLEYRRYAADWHSYGKAAGPMRNKLLLTQEWCTLNPDGTGEMLWRPSRVDLLIGFPEPGVPPKIPGSGSWDCIGQAFAMGIETVIPGYEKRGM